MNRAACVVGLTAALLFSTVAHASTPLHAKASTRGPFHLVFDREKSESVGSRYELAGTWRRTQYTRGSQEGLNLGDNDDYLEAQYDVIEKVTGVSDNGGPNQYRVFFRTFKMRTDSGATFDDASCVGVPIDVTEWPDVSIAREDGQEILPDEMTVLRKLYPKSDPASPSNDDILAPGRDVSVGDTWRPTGDVVTRYMQSKGLIIPDNSVDLLMKVADRRKVNGIDCLIVDFTMSCPNVDGDSNLPAEVKSAHGSFQSIAEFDLPLDPTMQTVTYKETINTKDSASWDKDDQIVEVKFQQSISSTVNFVKAL